MPWPLYVEATPASPPTTVPIEPPMPWGAPPGRGLVRRLLIICAGEAPPVAWPGLKPVATVLLEPGPVGYGLGGCPPVCELLCWPARDGSGKPPLPPMELPKPPLPLMLPPAAALLP